MLPLSVQLMTTDQSPYMLMALCTFSGRLIACFCDSQMIAHAQSFISLSEVLFRVSDISMYSLHVQTFPCISTCTSDTD